MPQIICFGASIVQGYADPVGGWTQRLRQELDQRYTTTYDQVSLPTYDVFNLGISGDTSAGLLQRMEQEIIPRKLGDVAAIIISIGVNDSVYQLDTGQPHSTLEEYQENLQAILTLAKKHTSQVLFLGLTPCDETKTQPLVWSDTQESYSNERIGSFNAVAKNVSRELDITFVELFDDFPRDCLYDGIHPTSDGHQFIAAKVLQALVK